MHRRPRALITGASSGIGEAFAHVLAERGHDLVLVARRQGRLEELAARLERENRVTVAAVPMDLATATAADSLCDRLSELGLEIDVLVNNAGVAVHGRFLDLDWSTHESLLHLFITTPVKLVHHLAPMMVARGAGRVINVSSTGGLFPAAPLEGLYGPSKAFEVVFTRNLAEEYRESKVTFTVACPGITRTEIYDGTLSPKALEGLPRFVVYDARAVADRALRASESGRTVAVLGWPNRLAVVLLQRLLPAGVSARLVGRLLSVTRGRAEASR